MSESESSDGTQARQRFNQSSHKRTVMPEQPMKQQTDSRRRKYIDQVMQGYMVIALVLPEKISADPSAEQIFALRQALHNIHQLTCLVN